MLEREREREVTETDPVIGEAFLLTVGAFLLTVRLGAS